MSGPNSIEKQALKWLATSQSCCITLFACVQQQKYNVLGAAVRDAITMILVP